MKTQMRFQKVLMLLTLIIAALAVVYSLCFCSGVFNQITQLKGSEKRVTGLAEFLETIQGKDNAGTHIFGSGVNDKIFIISVVLVVVTVLPFIASCQKRRNYYITNYIAIGIVVVYQIIFVVLLLVYMGEAMQAYNGVNLDEAKARYETLLKVDQFGAFSKNTWTITVGYVLVGLVIANIVALLLNLTWKIMLMKGEKALLNNSEVKEAM